MTNSIFQVLSTLASFVMRKCFQREDLKWGLNERNQRKGKEAWDKIAVNCFVEQLSSSCLRTNETSWTEEFLPCLWFLVPYEEEAVFPSFLPSRSELHLVTAGFHLGIEGVCLREVVSIARGCWDQSSLLAHKDSVTAVCPPWAHCLPSSYFLCKWRSRGHGWPRQGFGSPFTKPHSLTGVFSLLDSWKSENWRGRAPTFRVAFPYNYFRDTICNIKTKNLPPLATLPLPCSLSESWSPKVTLLLRAAQWKGLCVRAERCPAAFHAL